jgi:hypothetical protein
LRQLSIRFCFAIIGGCFAFLIFQQRSVGPVHAAGPITYEIYSGGGDVCTAVGGSSCGANFSIPSGVFVDLGYLPICTYNTLERGIIYGPYVAGMPSGQAGETLRITRTATRLSVAFYNTGGSATSVTLRNLGCILTHN